MMEDSICEVAWDSIRVSPFQPRKEIAENELEELAASIKSVGLIHPPVVRRIMQGDQFLYYELIAGERRWRATKLAGFTSLIVIVRASSDDSAAKASLIENIQRVDLNPIEMAEAFKKLLEVFRMTQEEVADKMGKKRSTVANYLRLLSLPSLIRGSLVNGVISMGHAKAILSLDSFALKERLHQMILEEHLTVRQAEKEGLKLALGGDKKKKSVRKHTEHIADLEERLSSHFGTKVVIQHGKKEGKLVFHYYSLDDLDRLLEIIKVH